MKCVHVAGVAVSARFYARSVPAGPGRVRAWRSSKAPSRRIHASLRPTEALPQHVGYTADLIEHRGCTGRPSACASRRARPPGCDCLTATHDFRNAPRATGAKGSEQGSRKKRHPGAAALARRPAPSQLVAHRIETAQALKAIRAGTYNVSSASLYPMAQSRTHVPATPVARTCFFQMSAPLCVARSLGEGLWGDLFKVRPRLRVYTL